MAAMRLSSRRSALALVLLGSAVSTGVACGDDSSTTTAATTGAGGSGSTGTGGGDACVVERRAEDDAPPPPVFTPRWAMRPWISKDISNRDDTYTFVDGFLDRDIPVAAVVLDSPWETNYNTFEPNPSRYADFAGMVEDLRGRGIRVVLWTTQMMNQFSFDVEVGGDVYDGPAAGYDRALDCGWFVNDGELSYWWKGRGSGIDFFDPDARAFYHRLQDRVLDLGVAGFKLDFGENYIATLPMTTDEGVKSLQEYSEAYYRDFYAYGAARLGTDEFVTMVRPYDKSYEFEGRFFARPEHAPVGWVGDNRRDDLGLADALDHIFRSARAGYAAIGSDIGGYLDRNDEDLLDDVIPFDADNFRRWTAIAVFTPFFQLHGRANLEPWAVPDAAEEVTATYRQSALLHDALVPFFDALVRAAYDGGEMPIRPVGEEASWAGDYRFFVGDAFFVAPPLDGTGERTVALPEGHSYRDLWDLTATPIEGGATLTVDTSDPDRIPVWVVDGALVPLEAHADVPSVGDAALEDLVQLLVVPGRDAALTTYAEDGTPAEVTLTSGAATTVSMSAVVEPTVLRVLFDGEAASVSGDVALTEVASLAALEEGTYFVDAAGQTAFIRLAVGGAAEVTVAGE